VLCTKVAVGKIIAMMKLFSLSNWIIKHVTRGAVSFEQHFEFDGRNNVYQAVVTYPNGYIIHINCRDPKNDDSWVISSFVLSDEGVLEKDMFCGEVNNLTETEIISYCDTYYFLPD
jgi:hypothetical protein